jgi:hypothetical protein
MKICFPQMLLQPSLPTKRLCLVVGLDLLLISCGMGTNRDLTKEQQSVRFDVKDCSKFANSQVHEFVRLRKTLTQRIPHCSDALDNLAISQSEWLVQNPTLKSSLKPHEQRAGTPGYTGSTLAMRLKTLNIDHDDYYIMETIAEGEGLNDVWGAHLGSVLHRSMILAPGLYAFGHAKSGSITVFTGAVAARSKGVDPVFYPNDGATVGAGRLLSERPAQDLSSVGMGFPISVHFPWQCSEVSVRKFEVRSDDMVLPGNILTKKELPLLQSSDVFLITDSLLPVGKTVNVLADIDCGSLRFQRTWFFKTGH